MQPKIINSRVFPLLATILFSLMVVVFVVLSMAVSFESTEHTYTAFIKNQLCVSCIPMIVLCLLFFLFGLLFFKKMDSDVIENWMIIVWFSFCVILVMYIIVTISIHYMDMKNEDYITYTGEFEKDHTRDFVFLSDEKSTRLNNRNETFLKTGKYSGTVLYSKRSKYVLSYSLKNGEKASVADQ